MCKVVAVCSGTPEERTRSMVEEIELVAGRDAADHDRPTTQQIGLIGLDSIEHARKECPGISPGSCSEDITIAGLDLEELPEGTRLWIGVRAVVEITGPGGTNDFAFRPHRHIVYSIGPRGLFARVVTGGTVRRGDQVVILSLGRKSSASGE